MIVINRAQTGESVQVLDVSCLEKHDRLSRSFSNSPGFFRGTMIVCSGNRGHVVVCFAGSGPMEGPQLAT